MRFLDKKTNFDFMGKRKIAFVASVILLALGIFAAITIAGGGGNIGIQFVGGTQIEGFFAVGRVDDVVSGLLEFERDDALVVFVVFDDEYRRSVRSEVAHAADGDLRTFSYRTRR